LKWLCLLLALGATASADPESDADAGFRAAEARAVAGDGGAIDAFEQVGAARPVTRWTDDAWLEAGRLAERAGDYARARKDLQEAISTATDDQLARRARGELAIVEHAAGAGAEWSAVAAEHDRLERELFAGDPKPAIAALENLIAANPKYPRVALVMLLVAQGLARDGDADGAIAWLRRAAEAADARAGDASARDARGPDAAASDRTYVRAELVKALVRAEQLDAARAELAKLDAPPVVTEMRREIARAQRRALIRWLVRGLLVALLAAAAIALRRAAGSWRAAVRRLVRPPGEVWFFAPIAAVLAVLAGTGNPMVAHAVWAIAGAGVVVAWLSGAILDAARARSGRVRLARAAAHAVLAVAAIGSAAYLAVDHDRMIDLVVETWH